jgi:hypothetical protein
VPRAIRAKSPPSLLVEARRHGIDPELSTDSPCSAPRQAAPRRFATAGDTAKYQPVAHERKPGRLRTPAPGPVEGVSLNRSAEPQPPPAGRPYPCPAFRFAIDLIASPASPAFRAHVTPAQGLLLPRDSIGSKEYLRAQKPTGHRRKDDPTRDVPLLEPSARRGCLLQPLVFERHQTIPPENVGSWSGRQRVYGSSVGSLLRLRGTVTRLRRGGCDWPVTAPTARRSGASPTLSPRRFLRESVRGNRPGDA